MISCHSSQLGTGYCVVKISFSSGGRSGGSSLISLEVSLHSTSSSGGEERERRIANLEILA